jgi:hypothetical protein
MTKQIDWSELHRLNRVWRQWMDGRSKFVTPSEPVNTLRYAADESREAKREYRIMHADMLAEYLLEVAPVGTKALLDAADDVACKARDVWMREQLPEHARNNKRARTVRQELAQVVMLILTALPEISTPLMSITMPQSDRLLCDMDSICDQANQCVKYFDSSVLRGVAHTLLVSISIYPGVEVEADLRQCWSVLAWKHASLHIGKYPEELK